MNTSLEKRVEQLERRLGTEDDFRLIIIQSVGCDPTKMGAERAIYREVTGYSAVGRDRRWSMTPSESVEDLKSRIGAELRVEGHKVYAICEC